MSAIAAFDVGATTTRVAVDAPLSLRARLRSYIDVPITIENDVKTAALGLVDRVPDPRSRTLTYLYIGTGIAPATVVNGPVLRGVYGSAAEIGQIQLERPGKEGAIHLAPQIPEMSGGYIQSAKTEGETA